VTKESIVEWAAHWVRDEPPGQRARFAEALAMELKDWREPAPVPRTVRPYPEGMGEESRRPHREYNALVAAQLRGEKNGAAVVKLTDECSAKGIILVPNGENV
jgi:hypothetical protein